MSKRAKLSTHEASHAVIRVVLGGAVQYVTVNESDPHARPLTGTRLSERDEHVITYAGMVAEFAFYPAESRFGHYGGDDLERAASWTEAERQEAAARAKQLVTQHRAAIRKLSDELLSSRIALVNGARVHQIVKGGTHGVTSAEVLDKAERDGEGKADDSIGA